MRVAKHAKVELPSLTMYGTSELATRIKRYDGKQAWKWPSSKGTYLSHVNSERECQHATA